MLIIISASLKHPRNILKTPLEHPCDILATAYKHLASNASKFPNLTKRLHTDTQTELVTLSLLELLIAAKNTSKWIKTFKIPKNARKCLNWLKMNCQNMYETIYLTFDIYYLRLASWNLQPLVKKLLPLATIVRLTIFYVDITCAMVSFYLVLIFVKF